MITVSCSCGKTYKVKDSYANKKAKCTCGQIISVPAQPDVPLNKTAEKISFSCKCGKDFAVPEKFEGKKVRCKSCQRILQVPTSLVSGQPDDEAILAEAQVEKEISEAFSEEITEDMPDEDADVPDKPSEIKESSEKPGRLVIICLIMVLIGAIAFMYFSQPSDDVIPVEKPAVPSATVPEPSEKEDTTEVESTEAVPDEEIMEEASEAEAPEPSEEEETEAEPAPQQSTETPKEKQQTKIEPPPAPEKPVEEYEPSPYVEPVTQPKTDSDKKITVAAVDQKAITEPEKKLFRTNPMTYNKKQVVDMVQQYNFYEARFNPNGGFPNRFVDNRNGTITDNETHLMWQKSGTREMVTWKKAPEFIDRLNNRKYAGYDNWRLPTLEELMTLTEPRHSRQGLYISSFFSQKQGIVGSSDTCTFDGKKIPWYISFLRGISNCISYDLIDEFHVRAVRSIH